MWSFACFLDTEGSGTLTSTSRARPATRVPLAESGKTAEPPFQHANSSRAALGAVCAVVVASRPSPPPPGNVIAGPSSLADLSRNDLGGSRRALEALGA
jgi:hypothetical protein